MEYSTLYSLILSFFLFPSIVAANAAAPITSPNTDKQGLYKKLMTLKVRDIQRITGKKMTLKQKIAFGIFKHSLKKKAGPKSSGGQVSMILGIFGIALLAGGLFVGALLILSGLAAIAAIVVGATAKKKNPEDRHAFAGQLLGWMTLGLIVALLLLVVLLFSAIF